jgi:magnesium chelatase family protein
VQFLDELPELSHRLLKLMRQPLKDKSVTVSRSTSTLTFPAGFMLVAAMSPCPCGYTGHAMPRTGSSLGGNGLELFWDEY